MTSTSDQLFVYAGDLHDIDDALKDELPLDVRYGWKCILCNECTPAVFHEEIAHMLMMRHTKESGHKKAVANHNVGHRINGPNNRRIG